MDQEIPVRTLAFSDAFTAWSQRSDNVLVGKPAGLMEDDTIMVVVPLRNVSEATDTERKTSRENSKVVSTFLTAHKGFGRIVPHGFDAAASASSLRTSSTLEIVPKSTILYRQLSEDRRAQLIRDVQNSNDYDPFPYAENGNTASVLVIAHGQMKV